MTSPMCSGGFQPGASRTSDGRIWFPTTRGLAIINPTDVTTNTMPPPVVIEEMAVDGATFQVLDSTPPHVRGAPLSQLPAYFRTAGPAGNAAPLQIPPGRQRFEFHYAGLSYIAPEKVRFKYKLEGLEQGWNDANTKRVAQYSYLPPGSYRFRVIACNNDGVWNANGATLAFTVLPFFWQTWWFQLCSLSSGAGAVGAGVFWLSRIRVKQRLDQVERQRALERERARIARDIHDDLGASLTRITLLSQSVRSEVEGKVEVAADVDQIYSTARELTRAMDEIVWAVNPKHDTLDSLVTYLGRFAQQFLTPADIRCRLDVPLSLPSWTLTSEIRHNTFLALKEALNNVVKHAAATEVRICLAVENEGFVLLVIDDGHGFDSSLALTSANSARAGSGNGLINMQKRMEEIGGMCDWSTAPGEGTRVKFSVGVRC